PARHRVFADLVVLDGRLYLGGGFSRGESGHFEPARSIEVYDPATGSWETALGEAPIRAEGLRMATLGGRLLLVGHDPDDGGRLNLALVAPRSATVVGLQAE